MRMGCKPSACAKPIPSLTGAAGCGGAVRTADRVRLWMRSPPVGDDLHLMIMPTPLVSGSTDEAAAARAGKPASKAERNRASADSWSLHTKRMIVLGPAFFLLAALVAVIWGLAYGGGATPLIVSDPGPVVMWGVPIARLALNLSASVTIGALVLAAWAASRKQPEFERAMTIASSGAAAWVISTAAAAFLTYLQISNAAFSFDAAFGQGLLFFFTSLELGQAWVLAIGMVLLLSVVVFASRSPWMIGLSAAFSLFCLWPLGAQGHAAGAANHETVVGGITLHYMGAALWLGGLLVVAILAPRMPDVRRLAVLERYSTLALIAFIVVAASGVVASVANIGSFAELATPYGVIVIVKAVVLILLGFIGWAQRRGLISRMRTAVEQGTSTRKPLVWLISLELAFMGIASGAAAALGRTPSPVTELTADQLASPTPAQLLTGELLPPEFEPFRLLTEWRLDPMWTTLCLFGLFFYIAGVLRLRRRGDEWPLGRTISFVLGVLILLYLVNGSLIVYGKFVFSFHMTQHMFLTMLVPIMFVLSAPMTLLLRAVHARHDGSLGTREWALKFVHSRWAKFFSHPIVSAVVFAGSLLVFYYTPLFRWAVTDHVGHMWMVADFLIVGYLFANALIGIDPIGTRAPYPMRLIALVLVMTFHAFFGLSIMSGTGLLLADWYGAMGRPWGADAITDQQIGGAIAWGVGEVPTVILAMLVAFSWSRSDDREAKRRDRKADRDGDAELEAYNAQLKAMAERTEALEKRKQERREQQAQLERDQEQGAKQ